MLETKVPRIRKLQGNVGNQRKGPWDRGLRNKQPKEPITRERDWGPDVFWTLGQHVVNHPTRTFSGR